VIGIGVNCIQHPAGTEFPATDLAAAGVRASPEGVFEALSGAVVTRLAQWNCGAGFEAVRAAWLERASGRGKPIRVAEPAGERTGMFETIDERGRLMLRLPDGRLDAIAAGDVFMPARP
jgi:BirA family biotin operon repressor/biotin-[acetyl-CoA-carboxylase] ligase